MSQLLGFLTGEGFLGLLGGAFIASVGYLGIRFTSSQSRAAQDAGTAVEGFDKLTGRMADRLKLVEDRLDVVEPLLRDTTRVASLAIGHIERLYDLWPRRHKTPPPIPHELVEHLPNTIIEDPTIPPASATEAAGP